MKEKMVTRRCFLRGVGIGLAALSGLSLQNGYAMTLLAEDESQSLSGKASSKVVILCYHDVGKLKTEYAMTPENLDSHFAYLQAQGYHPISLEQYIAASKGEEGLPDKPVLLSFDDGYRSLYTEIFPLLKKYNYPAMMAIVTSWPDGYTNAELGPIVTWDQLREMDQSGLVALASHSQDSHRYQTINAYGDSNQMLESFSYRNGSYETIMEFKERVRSDFHQSQVAFVKYLGHKVKALVWPFGCYNQFAREIGQQEGFEAFFGLGDGLNKLPGTNSLLNAKRVIVMNNPSVNDFAKILQNAGASFIVNAAQLDIDMIYDADSVQMEQNLNQAISRFGDSKINVVFLQTFSDPDGKGNIESVYFHTDKAPVKADVFGHVASRLGNAGFRVYAWLPTLSNQWLLKEHPEAAVVAEPAKNLGWYKRVTPFSPLISQALSELVGDLMAYSNLDGILFQDDMYLNDFEDYSPAAKKAFLEVTGRELTPETLKDKELCSQWMHMKTDALTNLTLQLIKTAKQYHPSLKTARNLYPSLITESSSQEWFAQNYQDYLRHYDYTVVMAYPYLEKQYDRPIAWLKDLASKALSDKANVKKVVFKLQTYDWNTNKWLSATELRQQQAALRDQGALHFAYYPENIFGEE